MSQILVRLAAFNFVTLVATFTVGWLSRSRGGLANGADPLYPLHFYLGLFAVLLTLAVHCLLFIYFLGTGRWVKEVALAYRLPDKPLPYQTRELKRRTFPVALLAMLVPIAAAAAGTAAQRQEWPWYVHATLATITLLVNLWAYVVEYRNVSINAGIIDSVMREVDRIRAEQGLPSNADALQQEVKGMRDEG
jgi:predicted ferric reductase